MTKDELIYELTRAFSETPGDTDIYCNRFSNALNSDTNFLVSTIEVDTIGGKQRIVLS